MLRSVSDFTGYLTATKICPGGGDKLLNTAKKFFCVHWLQNIRLNAIILKQLTLNTGRLCPVSDHFSPSDKAHSLARQKTGFPPACVR